MIVRANEALVDRIQRRLILTVILSFYRKSSTFNLKQG
jgi:hypothetical protein